MKILCKKLKRKYDEEILKEIFGEMKKQHLKQKQENIKKLEEQIERLKK